MKRTAAPAAERFRWRKAMSRAGESLAVLAVACSAAVGVAAAAPAASAWSLLPRPAQAHVARSHAVRIADGAVVAVRGVDRRQVQPIADRVMRLVAGSRGLQLHAAAATAARPAITFEVDPHAGVVGDAG